MVRRRDPARHSEVVAEQGAAAGSDGDREEGVGGEALLLARRCYYGSQAAVIGA